MCVDLVDWKNTQNVVKSLGDIDLLVNNAGVQLPELFLDVTEDSFDRQVNHYVVLPMTVKHTRQESGAEL